MKVGIIYCTFTGHSKKIAKSIAKEFNVEAQNIKNKPEFNNIDLLYIVGGIYSGQSMPEMINYVESISNNNVKKVALITSSCSKNTKQEQVRKTLTKNNIEVLTEEFLCQGGFLFVGFTHPNKKDIKNAVEYSKKIFQNELTAKM